MVFLFWGLSGLLIQLYYGSSPDDGRGTFGDMFGAINSLFSGLAFAGLIYTINIQRSELALQRQELSLQREEVRRSTEELAGQKEQMIRQRFETTFFNLLSIHNEIVTSIDYSSVIGRIVFIKFASEMQMQSSGGKVEELAFKETYKKYGVAIEHYYKNILTVIDFVNNEKILTLSEKQVYISFLKGQITPHELVFLYYNSLYNNNELNRQNLLSKFAFYNFFDDLNFNLIFGKIKAAKVLKEMELLAKSENMM